MSRKWGEINNLIIYLQDIESKGKTKQKSADRKKEKIRVNR